MKDKKHWFTHHSTLFPTPSAKQRESKICLDLSLCEDFVSEPLCLEWKVMFVTTLISDLVTQNKPPKAKIFTPFLLEHFTSKPYCSDFQVTLIFVIRRFCDANVRRKRIGPNICFDFSSTPPSRLTSNSDISIGYAFSLADSWKEQVTRAIGFALRCNWTNQDLFRIKLATKEPLSWTQYRSAVTCMQRSVWLVIIPDTQITSLEQYLDGIQAACNQLTMFSLTWDNSASKILMTFEFYRHLYISILSLKWIFSVALRKIYLGGRQKDDN